MLAKLTNRLMYVFAALTCLPTVLLVVWGLFFGAYYVFTMKQFDMAPYDGNYVCALYFTASVAFGILWAGFFGLKCLAENRQEKIDRSKVYDRLGY
jgi:hypothetical protein